MEKSKILKVSTSGQKMKIFSRKANFSALINQATSETENEDARFLYKTLLIRNVGEVNDIYNAEDVILPCEIFENRASFIHEIYGISARSCNSATSLNGCINRNKSKLIIALPTNQNIIQYFEKKSYWWFQLCQH